VTSGWLGLGGALVVAPAVGLAGALGGALLVGVAPGVVAGAAVPSSPEDALHADTASAATSATVARLGLRSAPTDPSCNTWDDGAVTTTPAPPVPTFKRRAGRVTPTQGDALERLWPALGLPVGGRPLDVAAVFGRTAPLVLEIGFGMGEATATLAHAEPHRDVLAVDVHTPGHGNLLKLVEARGLTNVRLMSGDARVVLTQMLPPASVTAVRVFVVDAVAGWRSTGVSISEVDLAPFAAAGRLLYEGAFVAERHDAVGAFVDGHRDDVDPTVGAIIDGASRFSADDRREDDRRLAELVDQTHSAWDGIDVLVVPTVPFVPFVDEVLAEPLAVNAALGVYTTFVNLLDLCAVAVPCGRLENGLPFGVTVIAPAGADALAATAAADLTRP
jgi:hypothetical protein